MLIERSIKEVKEGTDNFHLKDKIEIDIPADYINTEIEILIMPVKKPEVENSQQPQPEGILSLKGILGDMKPKPGMKEKAWESAIEV